MGVNLLPSSPSTEMWGGKWLPGELEGDVDAKRANVSKLKSVQYNINLPSYTNSIGHVTGSINEKNEIFRFSTPI